MIPSPAASATAAPRPLRYGDQATHPRRPLWRPILAIVLGLLAGVVVLGIVTIAGSFVFAGWLPPDLATLATATIGLFLAGVALVAVVCSSLRLRPGFVLAARGRFRWGRFWLALLVCAPVTALFLITTWRGVERADWLAALAVVVVLIPLQAAGEELAFRGGLQQSLVAAAPAWRFRFAAAAIVSAALFALAHQATSIEGFTAFFLIGLVYAAAASLTGGLEAPIALHVVNNLYSLGVPTVQTSDPSRLSSNVGGITWGVVAFSVGVNLVATIAVVLALRWAARSRGDDAVSACDRDV